MPIIMTGIQHFVKVKVKVYIFIYIYIRYFYINIIFKYINI